MFGKSFTKYFSSLNKLQSSIRYITPFIIFIDILLIYLPSVSMALHLSGYLRNSDKTQDAGNSTLSKKFESVTLNHLFDSLINSDSSELPFYYLMIVFSLFTVYFLFLFLYRFIPVLSKDERKQENSSLSNTLTAGLNSISFCSIMFKKLSKYVLFFYDVLFFRVLNVFSLYVLSNYLVFTSEFYVAFLSWIMLTLLLIYTIFYFFHVSIAFKFAIELKHYPYDEFSSKCDSWLFILKWLIAVSYHLNNGKQDYQFMYNYKALNACVQLLYLALISIFLWYFFLKVIFDKTTIIFYSNQHINKVRIFSWTVVALSSTIFFLFQPIFNNNDISLIALTIAVIIITSLIITAYILGKRYYKLVNYSPIEDKICYWIELFWENIISKNTKVSKKVLCDYTVFIQRFNIWHYKECVFKNQTCPICKNMNMTEEKGIIKIEEQKTVRNRTQQVSFNGNSYSNADNKSENHKKLLHLIIDLREYQKLTKAWSYSEEASNDKGDEVIDWFILLNNKKNNLVLIALRFRSILARISSSYFFGNMLAMQLEMIFNSHINESNDMRENHSLFYFISKQEEMIKKYINIYESWAFYKDKSPYNIVNTAWRWTKLKKKMKKELYRQNSINIWEFQTIWIKYIMEIIYQDSKVKSNTLKVDIAEYEDFLNESYTMINHIIIKHDFSNKKSFNIISSGKEFAKYKGKNLDSLCLPELREVINETFYQFITDENSRMAKNKMFSFPIEDRYSMKMNQNEQFISDFTMMLTIFPSLLMDSLQIIGKYLINKRDILILRDNNSSQEWMTFNSKWLKFLLLPPNILKELSKHNTYWKSEKFWKISIVANEDIKQDEEILNFDCNQYVNTLREVTATRKSEHVLSLVQNVKQIRNFDYYIAEKKLLQSPRNPKVMYMIISLQNEELRRNWITTEFNNTRISESVDNSVLNFGRAESWNNQLFQTMSTAESTTSMSTKMWSLNSGKMWKLQISNKKKQNKKIKIFTVIIICFNVVWIILTLVYLFININKMTTFLTMFTFFNQWNEFISLFFNLTLGAFFDICIAMKGTKTCDDYFDTYRKSFNKENGISEDFSWDYFFFYGLEIKMQSVKTLLAKVKTDVYTNENKQEAINLWDASFDYWSIVSNGNQWNILGKEVTFIGSLEIYVNWITIISNDASLLSLPIYIIDVNPFDNDKTNLDNILIENLTDSQISIYNILWNYPNYFKRFMEFNQLISDYLYTDIGSCQLIVNVFSNLIWVINLFLCWICFLFVVIFKNIIAIYYYNIVEQMHKPKYKTYLKNKIVFLKQMADFFANNPKNVISGFTTLNDEYYKREKVKNNTQDGTGNDDVPLKIKPKTVTKHDNHSLNEFLRKFKYIIWFSFLTYVIYAIIFYILLLLSFAKFNTLISIWDDNSNIDTYIFGMLNWLQIMWLTSQSDLDIANKFSINVDKGGYLQGLIMETMTKIENIEKNERENSSWIPKYSDVVDLNCLTFYDTAQDAVIVETDELFPQFGFATNIPLICNAFDIMLFKNDKILIRSIIFRVHQLKMQLTSSYEEAFNLHYSSEMYNLYVLVLIIFRPLKVYQNFAIFDSIIQKEKNWYLTVSYAYLFSNTVLELVLLLLVKSWIISPMIFINKSILNYQRSMNL